MSIDSQFTIIQAYAPTADSEEEQHDNFYEQLEELVRRQRGYVVVMGEFNARIAPFSCEKRKKISSGGSAAFSPIRSDTPVLLKGGAIEDVDEHVYLGSQLNMRNGITEELARRRKAGWAAFNSIRSVLEDCIRDCKLRADLFNSTVLPALSTREKPGL
ncbi:unnamed protein product [Haemonchus placei]|uniref:Endo/exonuclease/phosphatase domain-containing protein n=1 Tax=Haemonchus placei TaxID=6290 RepID=A0A3P7WGY3_HAEPC|nr:unnamed protein product [Haemonchus placei]